MLASGGECLDGGHRHSVIRISHNAYPSAVRVARYHTACTPEVRVHIASTSLENTAIRR